MSKLSDKEIFPRAHEEAYRGLTLREYYIGQALQGEVANATTSYNFNDVQHRKLFAQRVISAADAVLELLEQESKP